MPTEIVQYDSPTKRRYHSAKVAVIVGTFVPKGQIEHVPGRSRSHDFTVSFNENKLDIIKFNLACHQNYDAGIDYDLIIVDSSSEDEEALAFLSNSSVQVFTRPNTGFSFGSYQYAWEMFGDSYDYYLFCEQDIVPCKDRWLQEIVTRFLVDRDIGAVGNYAENLRDRQFFNNHPEYDHDLTDDYWKQEHWHQCNLDGAFTFISSSILQECGIQVVPMKINEDGRWDVNPVINELFWLHPILNAGYKLASFNDGKHLFTSGVCYVDFGNMDLSTDLSPMIHAQTLYCNPFMKRHFDWYDQQDKFMIDGMGNGVYRFTDKDKKEIISSLYLYTVNLPSRRLGVIEEVWTKEEFRRQGRSTKLIKQALQKAQELDLDVVELTVNDDRPHIKDFYKSLGFYDRNNSAFRYAVNKKWSYQDKE